MLNYTQILNLYSAFGEALTDDILEVLGEARCSDAKNIEDDVADNNKEMVDHPAHYNQSGMETIDEMELIFGTEAVATFCLLNCFKYRSRAPYKNNPSEDMEKANWYIAKYAELKKNMGGK